MKQCAIAFLIISFAVTSLFPQAASTLSGLDQANNTATLESAPVATGSRSLVASAAADYPVTPGDVYALNYFISSQAIKTTIVVEGDYRVNLAFLGTFAARGMTFQDLRKAIVRKVEQNYQNSSPQLLLVSTGAFRVKLTGEFRRSDWFEAWGLSRLSDVLEFSTEYASTRKARVIGADGVVKEYDLFKAARVGDFSQDPYLRSGDTVALSRAERRITVQGEVRRPGIYELLAGEDLKELVEVYGDGLLPTARKNLVLLTRKPTAANSLGERRFIDLSSSGRNVLLDLDRVEIPSFDSYLPIVYYEGAITSIAEEIPADGQFTTGTGSSRMGGAGMTIPGVGSLRPGNTSGKAIGSTISSSSTSTNKGSTYTTESATQYAVERKEIRKGEFLSQSLKDVAGRLLSTADLKRSFIVRKGTEQTIPVNLEKILYAYDSKDDVLLEPEDRIIIPFGSLSVYVTGEVTKSTWINTMAMTRLEEAVTPLLTKYSSIRDIVVKGENGDERECDLFRAGRFGDTEQNPLLKPGDVVTVRPLERVITIAGEVHRPGTYQLKKGEALKELIELYADGFTEKANAERLILVRYISATSKVGEKIQLDFTKEPNYPLSIQDSITVPPAQDLLPVVWFEGAIGVGVNGQAPQAAQRVFYNFFPGESLGQATAVIRKQFSEVSDLENAYIVRDEKKIPVDIARLLFYNDYRGDIVLKPADKVIIPFRQFFVSVSGAVRGPGRYPYVPDRSWDYYVGLAGGLDTEKNEGQKLEILDINGKPQVKERMIQPEDNIVAASNSVIYNFFRISTILTTAISLISLIISFSVIFR